MEENFIKLWDLKNLPLTELLGDYDPEIKAFDQALVMSDLTGHVQLETKIANEFLYTESDYSFRTGTSFKSISTIQTFVDFFKKNTPNSKFSSIVDVGGNDLTLARILEPLSNDCYVIDPVCSSIDGQEIDGINVIGKVVENVDLKEIKPDVLVCRHTLEHIEEPRNFLNQLFEQCPEDCTYIFEIPDFDCLMEGMRFDAVFHQHLHYFSLDTLSNLIIESGGIVTDHHYNFQGSCGGALFVSFKKSNRDSSLKKINIKDKQIKIEKRIKDFSDHMSRLSGQIESLPKPVFGYGAGLMLATYAYHLKTDFSFLEAILDDDLLKDNTGYKNIPITIRHPSKVEVPSNSSYIITSLENIRPIFNKISSLSPRRILSPFIS